MAGRTPRPTVLVNNKVGVQRKVAAMVGMEETNHSLRFLRELRPQTRLKFKTS